MSEVLLRGQVERHLIVLRPNKYNNGDLRLALFRDDYVNFVRDRDICNLYINFDKTDRKIPNVATYRNHGSITSKKIVSNWLHLQGFTMRTLLLFELLIGRNSGIHIYRFLGDGENISNLINDASNKLR